LENLIRHIRRFVELSEEESLMLFNYFKAHQLKKKEYLLREGQVCRSMYFVEKGCLRMFFHTNKTTEQITQFALDGWWMADYFSFMDQTPSGYTIQAVEKSEIYSLDFLVMEDLLKELPQMERYFRIVMQRAVAAAQLRVKYMFELSKEEFYNHFITSFPEFVQRVPQYMIASYLGLTPEYVSELRKKKG
jgi:CRP-like cAMP-binding protein